MAKIFLQVNHDDAVTKRFLTKGDALRDVIVKQLRKDGKALQGLMAQKAPVGKTGSIRLGLRSSVSAKAKTGAIVLRVGEGKTGWKAKFFVYKQRRSRVRVKGIRRTVHPEIRLRKGRYQYSGHPFWRRVHLHYRPFIQQANDEYIDMIENNLEMAVAEEVSK